MELYNSTCIKAGLCMRTLVAFLGRIGEQMEPQSSKLAVGIREAAQMLGVSPRTIQNYVAAKLLPYRKIGRRTVIPIRGLETFLRADQPSPVAKTDSNAA